MLELPPCFVQISYLQTWKRTGSLSPEDTVRVLGVQLRESGVRILSGLELMSEYPPELMVVTAQPALIQTSCEVLIVVKVPKEFKGRHLPPYTFQPYLLGKFDEAVTDLFVDQPALARPDYLIYVELTQSTGASRGSDMELSGRWGDYIRS